VRVNESIETPARLIESTAKPEVEILMYKKKLKREGGVEAVIL
jgi:hypothetical protein